MDVKKAVKDKANYGSIVAWFQGLGTLDMDDTVLLVDTIDEMSEEIYEHYRALCDIFKRTVSQAVKRRRQEGNFSFLSAAEQRKLLYAIDKAGRKGILLAEKYGQYCTELNNHEEHYA